MRWLIPLIMLLSACTIKMEPDRNTALRLDQHETTLNAIAVYVEELQKKGVLPKPGESK
jgi:hypothetical protein